MAKSGGAVLDEPVEFDSVEDSAEDNVTDDPITVLVNKKPTARQHDLAAFIHARTGVAVDPHHVKLVQGLTTEFRNDPDQKAAREARKIEREANKAGAAERKRARDEARAAALEAKAAAIRNGEVRGPGRPRKDAASASVTPAAPVEADDAEAYDVEADEDF